MSHCRSFQSFLSFCVALALVASVTSACNAPSTEANQQVSSPASTHLNENTASKAGVIFQAFNMRFRDIKAQLPELQKLGYTYIQVSPPQKSNPASEWWARYQPIDHTVIDSPLGTEKELKELIDAAHSQDIKIIIDVVLNHMANYGNYVKALNYPHFSPQDFHPKNCIDYNNRASVMQGWINCDLPDLKTSSPYVRQEAKKYLKKLLVLGADGFRFDAAKHIEPDYFRDILTVVPRDKFVYGEVIGQTIEESNEYTEIFSVTDFHLVSTMSNAFSYGGDLRSLINPAASGKALPGAKAITFAQNHDTVTGQIGYQLPSPQDTLLAGAFVLARQEGFPIVYRDDAQHPVTKAGVYFHQKMMDEPQYFRNGNEIALGADNPNMLFLERGNKGLTIINKAGESFDVQAAKMPGLAIGCYKELRYNFTMAVGKGGDGQNYITQWGTTQRGGIQIGSRDVMFFVQTSPSECK
ncbi:MAG: alpha-amylase [Coleofasciculus sp. S288]|nr:alpha-amylase [Coleofasciculus sp. S288]